MDAGVRVSIIVAVAKNGVIGRNDDIPWRLSGDLRRFKQLTIGKTVIVGRKTHESIVKRLGHPLEGRRTIVVTRDRNYQSECEIAHSLAEAILRAKPADEVFILGGAELYREALVVGDRLYLTEVDATPEGDAFFSWQDKALWKEVSREERPKDEKNEYASTFLIYERRELALPSDVFVNLKNARHDDQRAVMERIAREGVCPFCPENRKMGEVLEPIRQDAHWALVPNRWPYAYTTLHLMAIAERHVRLLSELTVEEWADLRELLVWAEQHYALDSGAVGIRFGDPTKSGATVDHLHVHLVVADPNVGKSGYERVKFPMGPKPTG